VNPEHPNAEPIRRSFDAFARGDMAAMRALVAEDTVWHIPGRGPLAGDHYGRDAVFEMFARLVQGVGWDLHSGTARCAGERGPCSCIDACQRQTW
jgi:ketosteroid isomerase-like protein